MRIAAIFAFVPTLVFAQSEVPGYILAGQLAEITSSGEACGYKIDVEGVTAWVEANLGPGDMSFSSTLRMMESSVSDQVAQLSGASLAAHCAAVTMNGRELGLIE